MSVSQNACDWLHVVTDYQRSEQATKLYMSYEAFNRKPPTRACRFLCTGNKLMLLSCAQLQAGLMTLGNSGIKYSKLQALGPPTLGLGFQMNSTK